MYIFGTIGVIKMATNPDSYMVFHGDTSTLQMYFKWTSGWRSGGDCGRGVMQYSCTTYTIGGFVDLNCR